MNNEYLLAAENLEAVAAKVEVEGLWCKNAWSQLANLVPFPDEEHPETYKAVGCAEGLLMDQLNIYASKDSQWGQLVFCDDSGDDDMEVWLDDLRNRSEWIFLEEAVRREFGVGFFGTPHGGHSLVTLWNDDDEVTEDDVAVMFHKAAHLAKEAAA